MDTVYATIRVLQLYIIMIRIWFYARLIKSLKFWIRWSARPGRAAEGPGAAACTGQAHASDRPRLQSAATMSGPAARDKTYNIFG